jgi:biopolymer transport protein TolR
MRRFYRKRAQRVSAVNDISLTPLIDTALTLLIIFMVATPMLHNAIKVTLPKGQAKEDGGSQQELIISVDKSGAIYFDKTKYELAALIPVLQSKVKKGQEKTVFVEADTAVAYGQVIELVDKLKVIGGIKYVALATQKYT